MAADKSLFPAREWSVLFPNGVRAWCDSKEDALAVAASSSGVAQWRTGWQDADVCAVSFDGEMVGRDA